MVELINYDVLNNSYMIWTDSEQLAKEYAFEKKEQFVFTKNISRDEIEAVKIMKVPVLKFGTIGPMEEILDGHILDKWLAEIQ